MRDGCAGRATKRAQVIRGGIDGAVGRRSEGVEGRISDKVSNPYHLSGTVDRGGYAGRATKRAQVIGGGIDGAVGRRSEGVVDRISDNVSKPYHLSGTVDRGGIAERATKRAQIDDVVLWLRLGGFHQARQAKQYEREPDVGEAVGKFRFLIHNAILSIPEYFEDLPSAIYLSSKAKQECNLHWASSKGG